MTKSFEERLKAIEDRLRKKPGAGMFSILEVSGCAGEIRWAYAGQLKWQRMDEETLEGFTERTAHAAFEAGEMELKVGGLPGADEMSQFSTFEEWFAYMQPNYSEIPPEEAPGFTRRTSRLGYGA
jgi:hypothetical protein